MQPKPTHILIDHSDKTPYGHMLPVDLSDCPTGQATSDLIVALLMSGTGRNFTLRPYLYAASGAGIDRFPWLNPKPAETANG